MKIHLVTALGAAALLVACSGSNKETRTASNTASTGTSTQGSVESTQSAAGSQGQVATQGSSTATPGSASGSTTSGTTGAPASGTSTDTSSMGSDRSGQSNTSSTYGQNNPSTGSSSSSATPDGSTGSTYGQGGTGSSGSTYGQGGTGSSGSTYGQGGTGSSGSTYGQNNPSTGSSSSSATPDSSTGSTYGQGGTAPSDSSVGTSGSRGSTDRAASSSANLKSAVGRVSKVDSDSKSIVISSRQGDRITLTVDDNTQIVDSSGSSSSDLSAIREGAPVRATFDPASNRAEKIEVMGKASKKAMHKKSGSSSDTTGSMDRSDSSTKARAPNPNTGKNPAQAPDTTPPSDQKQ